MAFFTSPTDIGGTWKDWLEGAPKAAYFSAGPFAGISDPASPYNASQRYWAGQQGDVYDQWQGEQGRQIRGGGLDPMSFIDFLDQYDFTSRYAALPPQLRGTTTSRFSPDTRYVY